MLFHNNCPSWFFSPFFFITYVYHIAVLINVFDMYVYEYIYNIYEVMFVTLVGLLFIRKNVNAIRRTQNQNFYTKIQLLGF